MNYHNSFVKNLKLNSLKPRLIFNRWLLSHLLRYRFEDYSEIDNLALNFVYS